MAEATPGNGGRRDLLRDVLRQTRPEHDFNQSSDFVGDGLLDSFDVVTVVAALEERLGIVIDGADVTPESFRSLDSLERLLERATGKEAS